MDEEGVDHSALGVGAGVGDGKSLVPQSQMEDERRDLNS